MEGGVCDTEPWTISIPSCVSNGDCHCWEYICSYCVTFSEEPCKSIHRFHSDSVCFGGGGEGLTEFPNTCLTSLIPAWVMPSPELKWFPIPTQPILYF